MKSLIPFALLACLFISSCTKDSGSVIMTYTKSTAVYGDLDGIRNTPLLESSRSIDDAGKIYIGADILLIGEEGKGIHVYNNSSPSNPQPVSYLNIPFCKEFFVKDNFIYAETQYDLVKIDISDLNAPFMAERAMNAFAEPLTNNNGDEIVGFNFEVVTEKIKINSPSHDQLAEQDFLYFDQSQDLIPPSSVPSSFAGTSDGVSGTVNRITEHNGYVYAISFNKILVFNNTASFNKVNEIDNWNSMETIFPKDDHLFIGTRNSMDIYSIQNPESPTQTSSYWHVTSCDPVLPHNDDDVAYVTLRTGDFSNCPGDVNALVVLDISNISNPDERQMIEMDSPYGMTIHNDKLYVGNGDNGLEIFDISSPLSPSHLQSDASVKAYDVIAHPTISNLILTSGPSGIEQYEFDEVSFELTLISAIQI